ncbi:MAG: LPS assembly protein LptD [Bdellovibrionaceae bacterium]|nr:LPS assembly protein LptD [Pseudobdellovibrionaceae bacterium]
MTQTKSTIGGDQIWLDYESNTGLISKGFVQSGNVIFEGELINKTGENDYYVVKADYTTCNNCPASWSFQGSQIRAELGGYAYIKNSFLKVGSIPVFWLPYLIVPLKSDRQTGLLTPDFESSQDGGLTFSQPFFWVISRNEDLTYTFKNYELRGLKNLLNYRYMLNADSYGELSTGWLRDKVFQNEDRVNTFRSNDQKGAGFNRWFIKYDHYAQLPNDYVHRMQFNNASDLQYPKDFPRETRNHTEPSLENRMSLTKNTEDIHANIDTSYHINLLKSDPLSGNDESVHRVPEIRVSKMTKPVFEKSSFLYSWDLNYLNLARAGKSYDDITRDKINTPGYIRFPDNSCDSPSYDRKPECTLINDGKFDPYHDLIRTGQRLDFKPTLSYPINLDDTVDILPKITYRETQYQFQLDNDPSQGYGDLSRLHRRFIKGEVSARTQLTQIYSRSDELKGSKLRHEVIPQLTYTRTPWVDRKDHPFWGFEQNNQTEIPFSSQTGISDGDISSPFGLQFDYQDRSLDREIVTFSVLQRLTEKSWEGNSAVYKQLASLTLSQSYDVYQSNLDSPNKQPWSNVSAYLTTNFNYFSTVSSFNYYPYQKVTNVASSVRLSNKYGNFYELGLDKQYDVTPGKEVDASKRLEDYLFRTGLITKYFNLIGQFVYDGNWQNRGSKRIKSWAYVGQFKPPGDCWLITLAQYQNPSRSQEIRLSFEFTFDGNSKPPLTIEALNQIIN